MERALVVYEYARQYSIPMTKVELHTSTSKSMENSFLRLWLEFLTLESSQSAHYVVL